MTSAGFASVILDVDSTLCGIEGIDWLGERAGKHVSARVADLTNRAMQGEIALESVYSGRLALVQPTRAQVDALADAYVAAIAPGAGAAIHRLLAAGRRVVLVSGGLREAILPAAREVGIAPRDVHAVSVHFDEAGGYAGFDASSPLTTAVGKRAVAESLALPARILAVGDGVTDLAMRPAVDAFAAFTGFVRRPHVVQLSDLVLESFDQLLELVLS